MASAAPPFAMGSTRSEGAVTAAMACCVLRKTFGRPGKVARIERSRNPNTFLALLREEWAIGATAPIFPGPVDAIGAGARGDLVDFPGSEEFDLTHVHGLLLQAC